MITEYEDYCSYEVAKLLKEKGFDKPCACCYKGGNLKTIWHDTFGEVRPQDWNNLSQEEYNCIGLSSWFGCISTPIHQKVRKWLREIHGIDIIIEISNLICKNRKYYCMIYDRDNNSYILDLFNSYEEAEDAAIKYCLENLI